MSDSDPSVPGAATEKLVYTEAPVSIDSTSTEERRPTTRRKPLLGIDDPEQISKPMVAPAAAQAPGAKTPAASPAATSTSYIVKTNRPANQRRGKPVLKLLLLIFLANLLLITAFGAWYYNKINDEIESRLARSTVNNRQSSLSATATDSTVKAEVETNERSQPAGDDVKSLTDKITDVQAQLLATQRRLAESEVANKAIIAKLEQLTNSKSAPLLATTSGIADSAASPQSQVPAAAPLNDDLLLLKERNRLTAYADEAISTASREPYERLWRSLTDSRLSNLVHATRSEILRVQNYYLSGSRLDRYDIPVSEYYPDSASLRDAQLSDEQLIRLLSNLEHPWEVRLKAANLLGMRRSTSVGDALVKTIKSDPNLDVVKEATFSFEQITGYHAQLFESKELDNWWKEYNETSNSASAPTPAAASETKEEKSEAKSKAPAKKDSAGTAPKTKENQPELKLPEGKPGDL